MKTTVILMVWVCGAWSLSACGSSAPTCGAGHDGVPVIIPDDSQLDTFWVGRLGVDELQVVGTGAHHDTVVQAAFVDFTNYQVQLAPTLLFGESCLVYTGQEVATGTREPLAVTSVTFGGLGGGDVVMLPDEFDYLAPVTLPTRGFEAPQVDITVASGTGETDFPGFTETIPAPEPPRLTRLGDLSPVDLALAPQVGISSQQAYDVELGWEAGDGDYIEVKIMPGAGSETPYGKLRCITFDDGCLSIPVGALNHLALDTATNFKLRIERHHFLLHPEMEGEVVRGAAVIDMSSSLEGVVLR